ncbi:hypothetical protein LY474_18505 [Myxococcus stipitatus]|uniref:hypothetical protein n=1 Tax=Myxococcus stipitatus TaxID=83455 RepID=UPI001F199E20|nr:hypothetical protein [Myxococcus stipitatus]MCE9669792.1 hypothetical protein [Myxococcus stipitatus]
MARVRPTSPRCPRCNAPFTLEPGQVLYTCHYCNASIDTRGEQAPRPLYEVRSTGGGNTAIVAIAAAGVLFATGMATFFMMGPEPSPAPISPERADIPARPPAPPAPPPVPPPPPPPAREPTYQWRAQVPPVVVDITGDGTDDIIGVVYTHEADNTPGVNTFEMSYRVAAYDGTSFKRLWEAPIDGARTRSAPPTRLIVQGERLVATATGEVGLLELATGKSLGRIPLSDAPGRLCIPQGDTTSVWVEVVDGRNLLLDTKTGIARPAKQTPRNCQSHAWKEGSCDPSSAEEGHPPCLRARNVPTLRGFTPHQVYKAHGLELVTGYRSPGTRVPMAAVFQPPSRQPLWHGLVSELEAHSVRATVSRYVELSEDAVFIAYELEEGGLHLVRRDARTGAVAWDIAIPETRHTGSITGIWWHKDRLYVPHRVWLNVFDAKTGHLLTTLGK